MFSTLRNPTLQESTSIVCRRSLSVNSSVIEIGMLRRPLARIRDRDGEVGSFLCVLFPASASFRRLSFSGIEECNVERAPILHADYVSADRSSASLYCRIENGLYGVVANVLPGLGTRR